MNVAELIRKKRDGGELVGAELEFLARGFANGSVPDYQASAWLMASFLRGMTVDETFTLTRCMKESGRSLRWRELSSEFKNARFADKHSTGGVGDKVSLVLAPLAALLGLKVPMMSGRGLGHTGGTLDKLQSIPGFRIELTESEMIRNLAELGVALIGQSAQLCPADKKLYSLRDVTGTIESVPLITASIVSKKWAEGIDAIVYDVKCGAAAFMDNLPRAQELSRSLVTASTRAGMRAQACITRMDEPLGVMVGNALEVRECLWMMTGQYPDATARRIAQPLAELCCRLAAEMAVLAGTRPSLDTALSEARQHLSSGEAMRLFEKIALAQGAVRGWHENLPQAPLQHSLKAATGGFVHKIHSRTLGLLGVQLGAGRAKAEDAVDPALGFELRVAIGDRVEAGQELLRLHARTQKQVDFLLPALGGAFEISINPAASPGDLVLEIIQ